MPRQSPQARQHGTAIENRIATVGYEKRTLDDFLEILTAEGIDVLIDVRETPWSRKPGFSKSALSIALEENGIEYIHAKFAGNPKRFRDAATSNADCIRRYSGYLTRRQDLVDEFEALVASQLQMNKTVCITCFERHPKDCHRGVLATVWQRRGSRVVRHLGVDDPRHRSTP